jgi:2-polyprenyl-3-methyl-5-hydroxy-6-metoxy-1,4-benzoquinol methylase
MMTEGRYVYFEDVNWGLLRLWGERSGFEVLDVGCGYATTSQYIEQRGNRVTGIESADAAVTVARTRISRVIQADLQDAAVDQQYDVVVFADVLEHVAWPVSVVKRYLEFVKDGGSVIVSLPNVGLWSVRLQHLFGRFEYEETGVLDRTHLRFFTRASARRMLESAGLRIVKRTYNPGLARPFVPLVKKVIGGGDAGSILESRPYNVYLKTVYPVERAISTLWPGMLAFQMIFEAKRR